jgi:hypothetical protein
MFFREETVCYLILVQMPSKGILAVEEVLRDIRLLAMLIGYCYGVKSVYPMWRFLLGEE